MSTAFKSDKERFIPEPGRYEGIDDEVYHRGWDALNSSTLGYMKRSADYCRHMIDHPREETDALEFGKAAHSIVLEPQRFDTLYSLDPQSPEGGYPRGWRNTSAYKQARADLELRGLRVLKQEDFDAVRRIRDNVYSTPSAARDILEAMTASEVSIVADVNGIRCKVRPDILIDGSGIVADLKTSRDASPWAFSASIYKYGYHRSKPFYLDTINTGGSATWEQYLFLVVENTPPYEFAVYDLDPEATDLGRRENDELMALYQRCKESGEWPGYSTEIQTVGVPKYAFSDEEND